MVYQPQIPVIKPSDIYGEESERIITDLLFQKGFNIIAFRPVNLVEDEYVLSIAFTIYDRSEFPHIDNKTTSPRFILEKKINNTTINNTTQDETNDVYEYKVKITKDFIYPKGYTIRKEYHEIGFWPPKKDDWYINSITPDLTDICEKDFLVDRPRVIVEKITPAISQEIWWE